ncbi:DUF2637 domain-containing protein [Sinosporangium siamense]|uniref:SpdA protein n=1 Tax=Sinosporangium siamense TaxID=1367973 RepID=A0A919RJD2_9ACTN|nr:DUF2637 domain-containing protein [Sinosporangium siamense]GII94926.1 SpdA protein [Sinosporangium siamense]
MKVLRRAEGWLLDSGPVVLVALIAGAGSFTHIRDTAAEYGQTAPMAWAIAVCVDLTCVMAARERQRDKRSGRGRRGVVSWPTLVLCGGILLSLAANLAQADPSPWGWIMAATPAVAFLVAVSLLERRAAAPTSAPLSAPSPPADTAGVASPDMPGLFTTTNTPLPSSAPALPGDGNTPHQLSDTGPVPAPPPSAEAPAALQAHARKVAAEHLAQYGKPITRDLLRARLGISSHLASVLLRDVQADPSTT